MVPAHDRKRQPVNRPAIAAKALVLTALAVLSGAAAPAAGETTPADEATLAEFKRLLPWAAAANEDTLAEIAELVKSPSVKLEKIKNQSLTACVLVGLVAGPRMDVKAVPGGGPAVDAMNMLVGMTAIKKEHIAKLTADVSADGKLAKGAVAVKNKAFTASFPFEARKLDDGKWQVFAFELPLTARRVERDADGKWRASELPTKDPLLRLYRAVRKAEPATLPVAYKADELSSELLAPYGWFRSKDGKPQPLAEEGKGVVLLIDADARWSELLALAKDEKTNSYMPAAVLTAMRVETDKDARASSAKPVTSTTAVNEFGLDLLPLPASSDAKPKEDADDLSIHVSSKAGDKDTPKYRIQDWETERPTELAMRLIQLRQAADMPIRIVPQADAPVKHVVAAVDATVRANLKNVVLVPPPAEKAPAK
jgi:hypothetical protein